MKQSCQEQWYAEANESEAKGMSVAKNPGRDRKEADTCKCKTQTIH